MGKLTWFLWSVVMASVAVSSRAAGYVDGWELFSATVAGKPDWNLCVASAVRDGQTANVARLFRAEISESPQSPGKPKPRPRLGGTGSGPQDQEAGASRSYDEQVDQAVRFLDEVNRRFLERWNSPLQSSEAAQWVHEIEAECVLAVDRKSGSVSIESISDTPASPVMAEFRNTAVLQANGTALGVSQPAASDPAELARLRKFVMAFAPLHLPDVLVHLPGEKLTLCVTLKVVGIHAGANSPASSASKKNVVAIQSTAKATDRKTSAALAGDTAPARQAKPQPDADIEDPDFHWKIGFRYLEGIRLKKDLGMAVYHFEVAAGKGYSPAQCQLGYMYQTGTGVARDSALALSWYRKAADQGDDRAMQNIGSMYYNGEGVARDEIEAAKWWAKADESKKAQAQGAPAAGSGQGKGGVPTPTEIPSR